MLFLFSDNGDFRGDTAEILGGRQYRASMLFANYDGEQGFHSQSVHWLPLFFFLCGETQRGAHEGRREMHDEHRW